MFLPKSMKIGIHKVKHFDSKFNNHPLELFLHADLTMMPNHPIKFLQNPFSSLGGVALTRFYCVKIYIWFISLLNALTVTVFLIAHLHMMPNLPLLFHQNPFGIWRGIALTRNVDWWKQTDKNGDSIIPPKNFVYLGYKLWPYSNVLWKYV